MDFWEKLGNADDEVEDTDWDEIHIRNFKCSVMILVCVPFILKFFTKQLLLMFFIQN